MTRESNTGVAIAIVVGVFVVGTAVYGVIDSNSKVPSWSDSDKALAIKNCETSLNGSPNYCECVIEELEARGVTPYDILDARDSKIGRGRVGSAFAVAERSCKGGRA